jgi:hypothetical protein
MYEIIKVKRDGACLFKSIAIGIIKALGETERLKKRDVSILSRELRKNVADEMDRLSKRNLVYKKILATSYLKYGGKFKREIMNVDTNAERYINRMRKHRTFGGHIETEILDKIIRKNYKKYFPGGLVVHSFNNNVKNNNTINYQDTIILEHMTPVKTTRDDERIQLNILVVNPSDIDTYFDLLWNADLYSNPQYNVSMPMSGR